MINNHLVTLDLFSCDFAASHVSVRNGTDFWLKHGT